MGIYSLTITKNIQVNFKVDTMTIEYILDQLMSEHYEIGYIGWELQPKGKNLLHIHTTISGRRMPYLNKWKDYCKTHGLNVKCNVLKTASDIEKWISYCHKHEPNKTHKIIQELYEEYVTQRPEQVHFKEP